MVKMELQRRCRDEVTKTRLRRRSSLIKHYEGHDEFLCVYTTTSILFKCLLSSSEQNVLPTYILVCTNCKPTTSVRPWVNSSHIPNTAVFYSAEFVDHQSHVGFLLQVHRLSARQRSFGIYLVAQTLPGYDPLSFGESGNHKVHAPYNFDTVVYRL